MTRDFKFFSQFFIENGLNPREAQINAIKKLGKHWDEKKFFILDLPTGVGKSFVGLAAIRAMKNGFMLTSSKHLQEQYINGPGNIVDLRGRSNYECSMFAGMNCANSPCKMMKEVARSCSFSGKCPYVNQRSLAMSAQTMMTNYSYFLFAKLCGPLSEHRGNPTPRSVMVCDEAHSLEDHLLSFAEINLNGETIRKEISDDLSFNVPKESLNLVLEQVLEQTKNKISNLNSELKELYSDSNGSKDIPKWVTSKGKYINNFIDRIDKWMKKLEIYFETKHEIEWVLDHDPQNDSVRIIPLEAKGLFSRFCEPLASKFVFMSATIGDPVEFAKELGLDFKDCCLIREKSDFPPENAPIIPFAVSKMNYSTIDSALPKIVKAINSILEHHEDDKGIIHTANYKIAKYIAENCKHSKRFIHRNQGMRDLNNEELFKEHQKRKGPSVLLSPSMSTGISLDDDLARFQIIVKLPFASMADLRVKRKMKERNSWYVNKMFLELMQSSGRPIRSKEDAAITYILDNSWDYFYEMMEKNLPEWFKERIIKRKK